jgi:hypothetical protein
MKDRKIRMADHSHFSVLHFSVQKAKRLAEMMLAGTHERETVNADRFRTLALSLPEATEGEHMGHPDFRVRGKIFATLWPDDDWGMVKLTPDQQAAFVSAAPDVFQPVSGGWGRRGATKVHLRFARAVTARQALVAAWRNTAPKRLAQQYDKDVGSV